MRLDRLARSWDRLGNSDPLWAILYDPSKKGNRWAPGDFYATGVEEVTASMQYVESLDVSFDRRRALDFGCGIGRLTQPLALYFERVDGIDIAPSMIERAREEDRTSGRCVFHVNQQDNLALFADETFDFVFSRLVLQHIEPRFVEHYVAEFLRVLRPSGVALFDIPSGRARGMKGFAGAVVPDVVLNAYRRMRYRNGGTMELHSMPSSVVCSIIEAANGVLVAVDEIAAAPGSLIRKLRYCVQKAE